MAVSSAFDLPLQQIPYLWDDTRGRWNTPDTPIQSLTRTTPKNLIHPKSLSADRYEYAILATILRQTSSGMLQMNSMPPAPNKFRISQSETVKVYEEAKRLINTAHIFNPATFAVTSSRITTSEALGLNPAELAYFSAYKLTAISMERSESTAHLVNISDSAMDELFDFDAASSGKFNDMDAVLMETDAMIEEWDCFEARRASSLDQMIDDKERSDKILDETGVSVAYASHNVRARMTTAKNNIALSTATAQKAILRGPTTSKQRGRPKKVMAKLANDSVVKAPKRKIRNNNLDGAFDEVDLDENQRVGFPRSKQCFPSSSDAVFNNSRVHWTDVSDHRKVPDDQGQDDATISPPNSSPECISRVEPADLNPRHLRVQGLIGSSTQDVDYLDKQDLYNSFPKQVRAVHNMSMTTHNPFRRREHIASSACINQSQSEKVEIGTGHHNINPYIPKITRCSGMGTYYHSDPRSPTSNAEAILDKACVILNTNNAASPEKSEAILKEMRSMVVDEHIAKEVLKYPLANAESVRRLIRKVAESRPLPAIETIPASPEREVSGKTISSHLSHSSPGPCIPSTPPPLLQHRRVSSLNAVDDVRKMGWRYSIGQLCHHGTPPSLSQPTNSSDATETLDSDRMYPNRIDSSKSAKMQLMSNIEVCTQSDSLTPTMTSEIAQKHEFDNLTFAPSKLQTLAGFSNMLQSPSEHSTNPVGRAAGLMAGTDIARVAQRDFAAHQVVRGESRLDSVCDLYLDPNIRKPGSAQYNASTLYNSDLMSSRPFRTLNGAVQDANHTCAQNRPKVFVNRTGFDRPTTTFTAARRDPSVGMRSPSYLPLSSTSSPSSSSQPLSALSVTTSSSSSSSSFSSSSDPDNSSKPGRKRSYNTAFMEIEDTITDSSASQGATIAGALDCNTVEDEGYFSEAWTAMGLDRLDHEGTAYPLRRGIQTRYSQKEWEVIKRVRLERAWEY
ncbi:hypothetical protein MMC25_001317 [Agyrium rufum]|nr:hypothetical protein [Agyrium rufum]